MRTQLRMKTRQQGAVLLVSLLMLLITTFIGFSAMETSNLENKMATSRELKEITFQSAEIAVERTMLNLLIISNAYVEFLQGGTNWPTASYSYAHDSYLSGSVSVQFMTNASTLGYSIRKGASGIATYYYQLVATASRANTNISSTHTQGIYVEGPSLN